MIKDINFDEYPIIKELIDKGQSEYIKGLYKSISRQMEVRRYYKMKFRKSFEPYIKDEDVYSEMELFLQVAPSLFKVDMEIISGCTK